MQTTRGTPLTEPPEAAPPERPSPRRLWALVVTALTVLVFDQVTKALVVAFLEGRRTLDVVDGIVQIVVTRNPGAAFSIGTGATYLFTMVALVVIAVIVRTARRLRNLPWAAALGLLLGGALGNLTDRLARAPGFGRGHVVDFLALPHWPVFNVADSAIVIGGLLAVLFGARGVPLDRARR